MSADLNSLTEKIIGASYKVANTLGRGFVEKVYENALALEMSKVKLAVSQQARLCVHYDGLLVGEFFADFIIGNSILVEIKAVGKLSESHEAQCLNYLKASKLRLALLLNFGGPSVEVKRLANHV